MLGGFIDVLAKIRVGRIDDVDIAAVISKAAEALSTAEADSARLPSAAFNLLTGQRVDSSDDLLRQLKEVTPEAVHKVATEAFAASFANDAGWTYGGLGRIRACTNRLGRAGDGHRSSRTRPADPATCRGADGVSLVSNDSDEFATVHYDRSFSIREKVKVAALGCVAAVFGGLAATVTIAMMVGAMEMRVLRTVGMDDRQLSHPGVHQVLAGVRLNP